MNAEFRVPPAAKSDLTPPEVLVTRLRRLVGVKFELTFKTRTDGSRVRNLVASTLEGYPLPKACAAGRYRIVPPKRKGLPRILREFLDTYIVTTGESYNLQVWNRNPAADSVQITFDDGPPLLSSDVRFAFVRVHPITSRIQTIVVLTPDYIVKSFGSFGKPTVKHQLMLALRPAIRSSPGVRRSCTTLICR